MPTDSRTTLRNYKKPSTANTVAEDFARHIDAMDALDADVGSLFTQMSGKASATHAHTIAQVTGLQTALDNKLNVGATFTLDDLSDVSASAPTSTQVLKRIGSVWAPGFVVPGEITGFDAAVDAKIAALVNGAPTTFDTLKEIADYIASDQTGAAAVTAALAERLRVDVAQGLTAPKQAQARANIALTDTATTALEADALVRASLKTTGQQITNWNTMPAAGFVYSACGQAPDNVLNTPDGSSGQLYWYGVMVTYGAVHGIVTLYSYAGGVGQQVWQREYQGGVAQPWIRRSMAAGQGTPNALLEDIKANGVAGKAFTNNAWTSRDITNEVFDPLGLVTLTSHQFVTTVDMWCRYNASVTGATNCGAKTRIWNVTDGVAVVSSLSISVQLNSSAGSVATIINTGQGFLTAGKTYRIETNANASTGTVSAGAANSRGVDEKYLSVELWRASP
jgi:hypothetical protein